LLAQVTIGDVIIVNPERERAGEDSVVTGIERQLQKMLEIN
jgi:hypothetical protein